VGKKTAPPVFTEQQTQLTRRFTEDLIFGAKERKSEDQVPWDPWWLECFVLKFFLLEVRVYRIIYFFWRI